MIITRDRPFYSKQAIFLNPGDELNIELESEQERDKFGLTSINAHFEVTWPKPLAVQLKAIGPCTLSRSDGKPIAL